MQLVPLLGVTSFIMVAHSRTPGGNPSPNLPETRRSFRLKNEAYIPPPQWRLGSGVVVHRCGVLTDGELPPVSFIQGG